MLRKLALGIDTGYKRYGFAIGHDPNLITPLFVQKVKNGVLPMHIIDNIITQYGIAFLVVGVNDDERSPIHIQHLSRNLLKVCKIRYGFSLVITQASERYTSYYGELMTCGHYCDAQAAGHILANWYAYGDLNLKLNKLRNVTS